jgi:predicted outer membrane protein
MTSGRAIGTVLIVLALVATLAALLLPMQWFDGNRSIALARSGWQDDGRGTWKTEYGPLTPLDRDFVRKVRSAGLWELPAGQSARERGERKSIQTVGDHLVDGHTELDRRAIEAGRTMNIALPNQPTGPQQKWLDQMDSAQGDKFERILVDRLRKAHGLVFNLVGLVRDQTSNSMVRSLATRANAVVLDHITVLEDTGLVDFEALNDVN